MSKKYDAIVIGTGQSGPSLAASLAGAGWSVAIIERKLFGGTCVNTGCIPTKTLIASARAAHIARRAEDYGVIINGSINVDMKKVKARKDEVSGASNSNVENWLKGTENLTVYEGHARFVDNRTIGVGSEILTAEKIFINVGARAKVPEAAENSEIDYLTNSNMMDVDFLPEHLLIIGGSYIGLEFGQMYRRFGSRVTVIEMGERLIHREDEDVSERIKEILENEGVNIRLNAECIDVQRHDRGVIVNLDCDNGDKQVVGTHLLWAIGRIPNTHDLGLENTEIETDDKGFIKVDDQLRTNVDGIWVLGDCNGKGAFKRMLTPSFSRISFILSDTSSSSR